MNKKTKWKVVARIAMKHNVRYMGYPAFKIAQRLTKLHEQGKIKLSKEELGGIKEIMEEVDEL